jgi:glycosyltransferase involved in cell wall biosynthesis
MCSNSLFLPRLTLEYRKRSIGTSVARHPDSSGKDDFGDRHQFRRCYGGVGVPLDDYRRTELPASSRLELVWIGEFIERKRPLDVLKVARELGAMGVHYRIRILGDGPLFERIYTEIRHHGLVNSGFAVGRAPSSPALATSRSLVHTAASEGLPRFGLEAVCVGRRIHGYDVMGVQDSPNAILVRNRNAAGLARAIAMDFQSGYMGSDANVANLYSTKVAEGILRFCDILAGIRAAVP